MIATLTITGSLTDLAAAAAILDEHFEHLDVAVESTAVGGWTVDTMQTLLRRLAPNQLALVALVSSKGGYTTDEEVRARLGNDSGRVQGLTGPISKHIKSMTQAGIVPIDASYVVKTEPAQDSGGYVAGFVMPPALVPVVLTALKRL